MPETLDPLMLARNEGQRTAALRIRAKIERAKQPRTETPSEAAPATAYAKSSTAERKESA
jgi:hypothetical protein